MSHDLCEHIEPDEIEAKLKEFQSNPSITRGHWEADHECEARDVEWNIQDQLHRLFVHQVYGKTLCLVRARLFTTSQTTFKLLGIPIVVSITDIRLRPGFFYQTIVFFNLIHFHTYYQIIPKGDKSKTVIDWYIVSHAFLKWIHPFVNRKYYQTQSILHSQDTPMRLRRAELRRKGFKFFYEQPDFINSNTLTNNTCPPNFAGRHRVSLKSLVVGELTKLTVNDIHFLVQKEANEEFRIWTDACPHEGGPLFEGKVCQGQITCPWHGLKFIGAKLSQAHSKAEFGGYRFELDGHEMIVAGKEAFSHMPQESNINQRSS